VGKNAASAADRVKRLEKGPFQKRAEEKQKSSEKKKSDLGIGGRIFGALALPIFFFVHRDVIRRCLAWNTIKRVVDFIND
jgi:hypothetical protein